LGPYYAAPGGAGVQILDGSLTFRGPEWSVVGLLRNDGYEEASVTVAAALVGGSGKELGTFEGRVLLPSVRPGEPAPFSVSAPGIDLSDVIQVRWEIESLPSIAPTPVRAFQILEYWSVSFGDRERQPFDPPVGPLPFVLFGGVQSLASSSVRDVHVITAWLDPNLQVVAVARSLVGEVPNDDEMTEVLPDAIAPEGQGSFYVVLDDKSAALAASEGGLTPAYWTFADGDGE
jgi:hypothetical protein